MQKYILPIMSILLIQHISQNILKDKAEIGIDKLHKDYNYKKNKFSNIEDDETKNLTIESYQNENDQTSLKIEENNSHLNNNDQNDHQPGEAYIVYFVIISLIIGAILREVKKITGIPYTPMLLLVGVLIGGYHKSLGDFGKATSLFLNIDPHGILLIFIPTLIFESAFNIEPFIFKKEMIQIAILAVIGVIIGISIIGFGFNVILGYGAEFSWSACLTFSAIICATDPVAVVALLKELGTSARFNMLLEGESLFNDGTAMVFYLMFSSIFKGQSKSILLILLDFVRLTGGGIVLGLVMCFLIILWLRTIVRDDILTVNLTFIACYLTFFIGEIYLSVSGIIAIVVLGIAMSTYGKVNMNPESEHAIHSVWGYIQYILETIIFLLTGVFIGQDLLGNELMSITKSDVIKMLFFFLIMIAARFAMLKLIKPLMNKVGWEINNKDVLVLTYGGLRGAIALCLALLASLDESFPSRFRDIVLFYVTSMILLTVLFNGLTIKYVMKKINFQPKNPIHKKTKETLKKRLIMETYKKRQQLSSDKFLRMAHWEGIVENSGIKNDVEELKRKKEKRMREEEIEMDIRSQQLIGKKENLVETRARFYELLKTEIWEQFEKSMCSAMNVRKLQEIIDICLEETDKPIWIWEYLSSSFLSSAQIRKLIHYKDTLFIGWFSRKIIISHLMYDYEILFNIIQALKNINETKRNIPINIDFINIVFGEIEINLRNCEDYLFNFIELFPDLAKAIQLKQASKILINSQRKLIDEYYNKGTINETEYLNFRSLFDTRIRNLEVKNSNWNIPDIHILQLVCPILSKLSEMNFELIKRSLKEENFKKGQKLYSKNKIAKGVYVILKGIVKEYNEYFDITNGIGSVLSFGNLINISGNTLTESFALEDDVQTIYIPNNVIFDIMNRDSDFEEGVYRSAVYTLFRTSQGESLGLDENKIHYVLVNSTFKKYEMDSIISLDNGAYLFSGGIKEHTIDETDTGVTIENGFIPAKKNDYKCLKNSIILRFEIPIDKIHLDDENRNSSIKPSFRDSFIAVVNKEKDVDKLYSHVEKKILSI